MKILTIIANPLGWLNPNNYGGGEINTVTSINEWKNQGNEITTIEPLSCSPSIKLNKKYEIKLIKLPFEKNNSFTSVLTTFIWTFKTVLASKNIDCDIIYASTSNISDILPGYIISKLKRKPLVSSVRVSIYDKDTKKIFKKLREEGSSFFSSFARAVGARMAIWILKRSDLVLTPCSLIKDTLSILGVKKEKITVLDHGIETEKIMNGKDFKKEFHICYFSRVETNKGIDDFLRICKTLSEKNPKFKAIIIGNGSRSKDVEEYIKKEKLEKNIFLPGFIIGDKKFDLIKKSKVVLYPTYAREGWGLIVPETLCCGTPLISYDNEITKNVFGKLKSVFFVKTGDINNLLETTKKIVDMGNKSYEKLKHLCIKEGSDYDIKKMAKMEINTFNEVLK
ncbi:glycosyltransferase [Candidatus Pacearchaeota archaeon]|nr:glycosyltransferase [Candidatus Pacearchaeota archaeon]